MSTLKYYYRIVLLVFMKNVYNFKPSVSLQILPSHASRHKCNQKLITIFSLYIAPSVFAVLLIFMQQSSPLHSNPITISGTIQSKRVPTTLPYPLLISFEGQVQGSTKNLPDVHKVRITTPRDGHDQ